MAVGADRLVVAIERSERQSRIEMQLGDYGFDRQGFQKSVERLVVLPHLQQQIAEVALGLGTLGRQCGGVAQQAGGLFALAECCVRGSQQV